MELNPFTCGCSLFFFFSFSNHNMERTVLFRKIKCISSWRMKIFERIRISKKRKKINIVLLLIIRNEANIARNEEFYSLYQRKSIEHSSRTDCKNVSEEKERTERRKEKRQTRLRNASVEFFTSIGPSSHLRKISSAFPRNTPLGYPACESFASCSRFFAINH